MKFTVLQKNLIRGLNVVSKAVNPRNPLPILSNILIKTDQGRIKLVASDLQITISTWIGAKIDKTGEITIPAKILNEFVSQITDEKIEATLNESKLNIVTDKLNAFFNGTISDEFPVLEKIDKEHEFSVDSAVLLDSLDKVHVAVGSDENRAVLTGILFTIENDILTLVGLDGFRLSEYKIKLDKKHDKKVQFIVPAKSLYELVKSISSNYEKINISINTKNNIISLKVDDIEAQIRLIAGEYPDYKSIMPQDYSTIVVVDRIDLTNAIKVVSLFSKDLGYSTKFEITENNLEIKSQPNEIGDNKANIKVETTGDDITICFNARYLLEYLSNMKEDKITIKVIESTKPGLFLAEEKSEYLYLVMPINANW